MPMPLPERSSGSEAQGLFTSFLGFCSWSLRWKPFSSTSIPLLGAVLIFIPPDPLSIFLHPQQCPWRPIIMNCITEPSCLLASSSFGHWGLLAWYWRGISQWFFIWTDVLPPTHSPMLWCLGSVKGCGIATKPWRHKVRAARRLEVVWLPGRMVDSSLKLSLTIEN